MAPQPISKVKIWAIAIAGLALLTTAILLLANCGGAGSTTPGGY